MRPGGLLADADLAGVGHLVGDDDELGIAAGESNLDAAGVDLAPDLESGLAEEVEQVEMERRGERVAHAASGLCGRLVAECGRGARAPAGWPGCDCRAAS